LTLTTEIPFPKFESCALIKPEIPEEFIALCSAGEFPERRLDYFLQHGVVYEEDKHLLPFFNQSIYIIIIYRISIQLLPKLCFWAVYYIYIHYIRDYDRVVRRVRRKCRAIERAEMLEHEKERKERVTTVRPVLDDIYGTDLTSVIIDFYDL